MTVLYWQDFDCTPETRAMEHPSTVHVHGDEQRVGAAFLEFDRAWCASVRRGVVPDARYHCFRGPRGLVRDVLP